MTTLTGMGCFNTLGMTNSSDTDVCIIGAGMAAVFIVFSLIAIPLVASPPVPPPVPPPVLAPPALAPPAPPVPQAPPVLTPQALSVLAPPALAPSVLAAGANLFAVGAGLTFTTLFTIDQIGGFENLPLCNEAGVESCARVNINFDAFDNDISIFGISMQRSLNNDLDLNTKFFEVVL